MAEQKVDVQKLLKEWERLGPLAGAPDPSPELLDEVSAFVFRLASALPELARVCQQHDDLCRAILHIGKQNVACHVRMQEGFDFDANELAKAHIAMARHFGWKPPRECD